MGLRLLLCFFIKLCFSQVSNLDSSESSSEQDTKVWDSGSDKLYKFGKDSIYRSYLELDEIILIPPPRFNTPEERWRYHILRRRVFKVYPYAKESAEYLGKLTERLEKLESKSDRKKYLKLIQSFLEDRFTEKLKKNTAIEGRILIRLLHRQTGYTMFEILKELKNGFQAFLYNSTASIFNLSLKEKYSPEENYEDYLIENILIRAFLNEQLEQQKTVLNFDYFKLSKKWRYKRD